MLPPNTAIAPTRNRSRTSIPAKHQKWTPEEDAQLAVIARAGEPVNWKAAESHFSGKTSQQIFERWTKVLDPSLLKGSWTRHEDEVIISFVRINGCKSWTKLSKMLPGRIGKQCRERWMNHLNPDLSRGPWTPEEDMQLLILHEQFGNSWSKIAAMMPTRADNMVKNRWYATVSKRSKDDLALATEKARSQPVVHPVMQPVGLPRPAFEDAQNQCLLMVPTGTPPQGTPGFQMTPVLTNSVPSLGLVSPLGSGGSPFMLMSPYGRGVSMFSPWAQEMPRDAFVSPARPKGSLTVSENRSDMFNLSG